MNEVQTQSSAYQKTDRSAGYTATKRRIVLLLLTYSAIIGVFLGCHPDHETPLDKILGLPFLIMGVWWCFTDAAERNHRIGPNFGMVLVFLFFIGFPIYLVKTRGVGAFKALGFTLLLFGVVFLCMVVTAIAIIAFRGSVGLGNQAG